VQVWLALFVIKYDDNTVRYASAGIDFAIVVRTAAVIPVQVYNQWRLMLPANKQDVLVIEESAKISYIFGIMSTITNVLGTILFAFSSVSINAASFLTEYFLSAYLTFNLFFLLLDAKVSSLLLDQLYLLADNKQLTLKKFTTVRNEIHRRVRKTRWAADLIIVPCFVSIIAIAVLAVFFLSSTNRNTAFKIEAWAIIMMLLKELFFVAFAFWYVAQVNGKADELTVKLSEELWCEYEETDILRSDSKDYINLTSNLSSASSRGSHGILGDSTLIRRHVPGSNALASDRDSESATTTAAASVYSTAQVPDIQRLSVHASGVSQPISFTLLFNRVTWGTVAVSALGLVVTIVTAIVNNLTGFDAR
jgi:hypothetical protein